MMLKREIALPGFILAALAAWTLTSGAEVRGQEKAQDKPVSFTNDIMPIFKASCVECHNPKKKKGKLDMSTYETLQTGGKHKTPWVAGQPEKSLIIELISGEKPEMPEEGDPLPKEKIQLITRWISEGAKDDTPKEK